MNKNFRFLYNDDSDTLRRVDPPHDEQSITLPLRHLEGTQAEAVCWGMDGGDIAYSWPSKVLENYYNRLGDAEDPRNVMVSLHRKGIDYLPILIRYAQSIGLKFHGSFRMNDCHHRSDPKGILSSRFWENHQEYRLWGITDGQTYYNASLDYSFPEVRRRRIEAIQEVIEWYDLDGIELDFCRNPYLFPPAVAWERRGLLTKLIMEVRQALRAAEAKRKKPMRLLVRMPFDESIRHRAGIDIQTWLDQGLIDALVMSGLFNDYNQRIETWMNRCGMYDVEFYPSIEAGPLHNAAHNHVTRQSVEQITARFRAAAYNFIGQGTSGVYLYNYPCHLFESRRTDSEFHLLISALKELGIPGSMDGRSRQYTYWNALPLQLESHRPAEYHQTICFHLFDHALSHPEAIVQLGFRQFCKPNPHVDVDPNIPMLDILPPGWITYRVNGKEIPESWIMRKKHPAGPIASGFNLGRHEEITLSLPAELIRRGENALSFYVPKFPEIQDPYIYIYEVIVTLCGNK